MGVFSFLVLCNHSSNGFQKIYSYMLGFRSTSGHQYQNACNSVLVKRLLCNLAFEIAREKRYMHFFRCRIFDLISDAVGLFHCCQFLLSDLQVYVFFSLEIGVSISVDRETILFSYELLLGGNLSIL